MKVRFSNCEVAVKHLRQGTLIFSENLNKFYYINGFKWLNDNNPILRLIDVADSSEFYISACLLVWLHD